jgi:indole-3-glycerol phosphate synthase
MTSYADRMLKYVRKATRDTKDTAQLFEDVMPILRRHVDDKPDIVATLEDVLIRLKQEQTDMETIHNKMREHEAIATTTQYDLAHLETFLSAMEEYFRGDLDTVRRVLDLIDQPILRKAFVLMEPVVFKKFLDTAEDARQARMLDE